MGKLIIMVIYFGRANTGVWTNPEQSCLPGWRVHASLSPPASTLSPPSSAFVTFAQGPSCPLPEVPPMFFTLFIPWFLWIIILKLWDKYTFLVMCILPPFNFWPFCKANSKMINISWLSLGRKSSVFTCLERVRGWERQRKGNEGTFRNLSKSQSQVCRKGMERSRKALHKKWIWGTYKLC